MAQPKTALITGITGQDGSYLADLLLSKGYRVAGLVRRSTHVLHENIEHLKGKIDIVYGDLSDYPALMNAVREVWPDEVYNFAAQSAPGDSWVQAQLTADVTAVGVLRLLEAVRAVKPDTRFYQASTREVFGGVELPMFDESTPFLPNNPYGAAKLYAHLMARTFRESYGMHVSAGILFNHESPRRGLQFVSRKVTTAVACIRLGLTNPPQDELGRPLVVDGKLRLGFLDAKRDWGYAPEYVEAAWMMLQRDSPEDYVIATRTLFSVRDLCEAAFAHAGLDWQDHVEVSGSLQRPTEITPACGDYSRAERELGWRPRTSFEDLIRLMVDADTGAARLRGRAGRRLTVRYGGRLQTSIGLLHERCLTDQGNSSPAGVRGPRATGAGRPQTGRHRVLHPPRRARVPRRWVLPPGRPGGRPGTLCARPERPEDAVRETLPQGVLAAG